MQQLLLFFMILIGSGIAMDAAAYQLPDLGNPEKRVFPGNRGRNIGMAVEGRLRLSGQLLEQAAVSAYINALGNKLSFYAPPRAGGYHFFVIDSPSVNAFAAAGGYIGINSALIMQTENEDQLAGVIAHEIGHVSHAHLAHSILKAQQYAPLQAAGIIAGLLTAAATENLQAAHAAALGSRAYIQDKQLEYSRTQEQQADDAALTILQRAGYDDRQMAVFLAKLSQNGAPEYLQSHPLPAHRIQRQERKSRKQQRSRQPLDYQLAKTAINYYSRYTRDDYQPQSAQAKAYGQWLAGLRKNDIATLQQALKQLPVLKHPLFAALHAQTALMTGQPHNAETILSRAWQQWQGHPQLVLPYARALVARGKLTQAGEILARQIEQTPEAVACYDLYGEILGRQGRSAEQFILTAKYYALIGNYAQALAQIDRALADSTLAPTEKQKVVRLKNHYQKMNEYEKRK